MELEANRMCSKSAAITWPCDPATVDEDDGDDTRTTRELCLFVAACNDAVTHQERSADLIDSCGLLSQASRCCAERAADVAYDATSQMCERLYVESHPIAGVIKRAEPLLNSPRVTSSKCFERRRCRRR